MHKTTASPGMSEMRYCLTEYDSATMSYRPDCAFEIAASCIDLYGPWTYVPEVAYMGPDSGNDNLLRTG